MGSGQHVTCQPSPALKDPFPQELPITSIVVPQWKKGFGKKKAKNRIFYPPKSGMCIQLVTVHRAILYQLYYLGVGLEAVRVQEQTLGESL